MRRRPSASGNAKRARRVESSQAFNVRAEEQAMRRRVSKWTWTLALLVGAATTTLGCVGGSKGTSASDLEKLKPYILDAVPSDIPNKLDINFENKVHIVGYKVDPAGKAAPGS